MKFESSKHVQLLSLSYFLTSIHLRAGFSYLGIKNISKKKSTDFIFKNHIS